MGKSPAHAKALPPAPARTIADALFSHTQQRVFSLVFGQPERAFGLSELIALAGSGSGAVQREVQKLLDSKLIVATTTGRQKRYQANHAAPIFQAAFHRGEDCGGSRTAPRRARSAGR